MWGVYLLVVLWKRGKRWYLNQELKCLSVWALNLSRTLLLDFVQQFCALLQKRQYFGRNLLIRVSVSEVCILHLATWYAEHYNAYSYTPRSPLQTDKCNGGSSLNIAGFALGPEQQIVQHCKICTPFWILVLNPSLEIERQSSLRSQDIIRRI